MALSHTSTHLIIAGPTAVGKSDMLVALSRAVELCTGISGALEVVSADAFQAYRGMDIGTAKPDKALCEAVPHHLVDILDPSESYSVGDFTRRAEDAIAGIQARGKIPVICGGTAYYIRHLMMGSPEAPPSDPAVRTTLAHELAERGLSSLAAELARVDPVSASRIHPNDSYRVLRALEVFRSAGRPLSTYKKNREIDTRFALVVLDRARAVLHERIKYRVREMFERGLRDEVDVLTARGFDAGSPGMKAIGYAEFFDGTGARRDDLPAIENDVVMHTRQYAKRQLTFFRSLPFRQWLDPSDDANIQVIADMLLLENA